MGRNITLQYLAITFFFVVLSELIIQVPGRMFIPVLLLDFALLAIVNPLSWTVYYVASKPRAYFKHGVLLAVYEVLMAMIAVGLGSSIAAFGLRNYFFFFNNPSVMFLLLNLFNPISWVILLVTPGRRREQWNAGNNPLFTGNSSVAAGDGGGQSAPSGIGSLVRAQAGRHDDSYRKYAGKKSVEGHDSEGITLAGYVGGGKTTFTALFVHAASYIEGIPGFELVIEKSSPIIKEGMEKLLQGEWPMLTLRSEFRTDTSLTLMKNGRFRQKKVSLSINDVSGELWRDVAEDSQNAGRMVEQLLRENPSAISLVRARKYVITVSCEEFSKWDSEQLHYLDLFRAIRQLSGGSRVKKPTAIIFTKIDLLPESLQNMHGEQLMKEYLPYIHSFLRQFYDPAGLEFFRVGIRVDSMNMPYVYQEGNRRRVAILGGGKIGEFPDIVRWMLD